MIRRLNFTGRKRIARGHAVVRLAFEGGGLRAHVTLALAGYRLPASARVFVEAHRQTTWQRFDFGTVAEPAPAEPPVLRGFGSAQGVRFRVRVVEAQPKGPAPRILAFADDLRPAMPPGAKGGLSLLPVDWGELAGETWRLEVDDESGPLLLVSRTLVPDREAFVGSSEFVSLVLPAALRRILERALPLAGEDEDGEGWAHDWLKLAARLPGVGPPPERGAEGDAEELSDAELDWVDAAVDAFGTSHDIGRRFTAWWSAPGAATA